MGLKSMFVICSKRKISQTPEFSIIVRYFEVTFTPGVEAISSNKKGKQRSFDCSKCKPIALYDLTKIYCIKARLVSTGKKYDA